MRFVTRALLAGGLTASSLFAACGGSEPPPSAEATAPTAEATAPTAEATAPTADATAPAAEAMAPAAEATAPTAEATAPTAEASTAGATGEPTGTAKGAPAPTPPTPAPPTLTAEAAEAEAAAEPPPPSDAAPSDAAPSDAAGASAAAKAGTGKPTVAPDAEDAVKIQAVYAQLSRRRAELTQQSGMFASAFQQGGGVRPTTFEDREAIKARIALVSRWAKANQEVVDYLKNYRNELTAGMHSEGVDSEAVLAELDRFDALTFVRVLQEQGVAQNLFLVKTKIILEQLDELWGAWRADGEANRVFFDDPTQSEIYNGHLVDLGRIDTTLRNLRDKLQAAAQKDAEALGMKPAKGGDAAAPTPREGAREPEREPSSPGSASPSGDFLPGGRLGR